ncbi:MAG: leucine--tRNA ligase [Bacteriovoracaceae bacterium]|nr:leucine--tRNA ligase [Bacteriovoracaceae bacterium]
MEHQSPNQSQKEAQTPNHYPFSKWEQKWQKFWKENKTFEVTEDKNKPKYYILDMFPYPSGAGLHVGHPLGYIASDVLARTKRLQGYNVLHPMGYDAFGLPAEQYAIQTGQHPAITTKENRERYRAQLDAIGFSFDWSREVVTCDPEYYHHTQSVFIDLFESWYDNDPKVNKARPIVELVKRFEAQDLNWKNYSEKEKSDILMNYRLAYLSEASVNWCPHLGTVLANDEIQDGRSVRGGHPVEQKKMWQWHLRMTAYAERLLNGLTEIDWPQAVIDMQRNWIGKSVGAEIDFAIDGNAALKLKIFTTRPDTIFGCTFMVIAPEHTNAKDLVKAEQQKAVDDFLLIMKSKTERDRQENIMAAQGIFTGSYAIHPFLKTKIPIYMGEYVLATYGTGAIMAVPGHDERDYRFAKKHGLKIVSILKDVDVSEVASESKEGILSNSDFLNGLPVSEAISKVIAKLEELKVGVGKTQFRLRDAIFGRQRYWGEPIPVYFENGIPKTIPKDELPLVLPDVDKYLPTSTGEPPLARAKNWKYQDKFPIEYSTMPGFAGSCAYFLRYMDPKNKNTLVDKSKADYWGQVDFYLGGSEHATGHLLYSRFWNHFLFDLGKISHREPFKKLFNQGMILGRSQFVYRQVDSGKYVSFDRLKDFGGEGKFTKIHVDVKFVKNDILDIEKFKNWREEYNSAEFILGDHGQYVCGSAIEKMSKSFYNVFNPDDIISEYGADAFRMYEMFLGPLEQAKPWNMNGIEGVFRFLNKLWRFWHQDGELTTPKWSSAPATEEELKALHTLIKKCMSDIEILSINTMVSSFMIAGQELMKLECDKKDIWEKFLILLSPFAPHFCEEIWSTMGKVGSISFAKFPELNESFLVSKVSTYAISFNGKTRFTVDFPTEMAATDVEAKVKAMDQTTKWCEGKNIVKVIVVPGKIVNLVLK